MLLELADKKDCFMSLKQICESQNISKKYLEQIVPMLNRSGILRTTRGNRGGYMLALRPEECTVGDVLRATEGSLAPVACLDYEHNDCARAQYCETLFIWEGLAKTITDYLDNITLKDILERRLESSGDDYCI